MDLSINVKSKDDSSPEKSIWLNPIQKDHIHIIDINNDGFESFKLLNNKLLQQRAAFNVSSKLAWNHV